MSLKNNLAVGLGVMAVGFTALHLAEPKLNTASKTGTTSQTTSNVDDQLDQASDADEKVKEGYRRHGNDLVDATNEDSLRPVEPRPREPHVRLRLRP